MRKLRTLWVVIALCFALGASIGIARYVRGQEAGRSPGAKGAVRIEPAAVGVRILLGRKDTEPAAWDGSLTVSNGSLLRLDGWRFRQADQITGPASWKASTRRQQRRAGQRPNVVTPVAANGVVAVLKTTPQTEVRVTTPKGEFRFNPSRLALGRGEEFLDGAASAERVPPDFPLTAAPTEDDFPAAAAGRDGTLWVAYVSYRHGKAETAHTRPMQQEPDSFDFLRPRGNGDQVRLARLSPEGSAAAWSPVADLTDPGQDVYRPAVAADRDGNVWVVWAQNKENNWDLYARRYRDGALSKTLRLTTDPGPDLHPALARDDRGNIWLAWQGFRGGNADILLGSVAPGSDRWVGPLTVSNSPQNDWDPQIACGPDGVVHVAWDTYDRGNYDIRMRQVTSGKLGGVIAVAETARFEARPSLVCDNNNRVWVAWEEAPEGWGKDFGYVIRDNAPGVPLYRDHTVGVRCYVNGKPHRTAGDLSAVLPIGMPQPPGDAAQTLGQAARRRAAFAASFPRLGTDRSGRVFLSFRRPLPELLTPAGSTWLSFVTSYEGNTWTPATVVPLSDGLLDNRPTLVADGPGGLPYMVHSSDGRNRAAGRDLRFALYVSPLGAGSLGRADAPALVAEAGDLRAGTGRGAEPGVGAERADVARIRGFRVRAAGKTYQLLRGEFHRHTEISGDGGGDGPLIDMWRYGLDVAYMDWIGNGDHDNGGGREYTWWLTQKLTDAFRLAAKFTPMHTYERSVRYPDGHRTVMFAQRGFRPLPRRAGHQPNGGAPGDTQIDTKYLRAFDGICASHTSATDMGTDWRDNDPKASSPSWRSTRATARTTSTWGRPAATPQRFAGRLPARRLCGTPGPKATGSASNRRRTISTHISYAIVYAEKPHPRGDPGRVQEAPLLRRHRQHRAGVRSGDHPHGGRVRDQEAPRLQIRAVGTRPVKQVVVVKDNKVVHTATPNKAQVDMTRMGQTRPRPVPATTTSVSLEQEDGRGWPGLRRCGSTTGRDTMIESEELRRAAEPNQGPAPPDETEPEEDDEEEGGVS